MGKHRSAQLDRASTVLPLAQQPAHVFDEAFKKKTNGKCLRDLVQKPRILLCGMHGAGKSTLINRFMPKEAEKRAQECKNVKGVHDPSKDIYEGEYIIMHDAQGFEGKDKEYFDMVSDFLKKQHEVSGADHGHMDKLDQDIHVMWFLHDLTGPRAFAEWEPEFLKSVERLGLPVILVLSKLDKLLADDDFEEEDIMQRIHLIIKHLQAPFPNVKAVVMLSKRPKRESAKLRLDQFVSSAAEEISLETAGVLNALPVKFGERELAKETVNVLDTVDLESYMYAFVMGQSVDFESKVSASVRHACRRVRWMTAVALSPIMIEQGAVFYLAQKLVRDILDIWMVPKPLRKTLKKQAWWDNLEANTKWFITKSILTFTVIGIPKAMWDDVSKSQRLGAEIAMKSCIFCGSLFLKYNGDISQATDEDAVEAMAAVQGCVKDIHDFVRGLGWGDVLKRDKVTETSIAKRTLDLMGRCSSCC